MITPQLVTNTLSLLTILGQISIVVILYFLVTYKDKKNDVLELVTAHAITFAFAVSLLATLGSLYYSQVAHFNPCTLCWYQRIFMYPQVLLYATAMYLKREDIVPYGIVLSLVGGLISLFHYVAQVTGSSLTPCSAVGYSLSCSDSFFKTFGYITIPMMALTAFFMIATFLIVKMIRETGNKSFVQRAISRLSHS